MSKQTPREYIEQTLRAANHAGSLMREPEALLCVLADAMAARARANAAPPPPECKADEQILLLLGQSAYRYWIAPDNFDWRSAQIASWGVPVACCARCRGEELDSGGLQCRGTTHSQCHPEASP